MDNVNNSIASELWSYFSEGKGRFIVRNSSLIGAIKNSLYILYIFFPLFIFGIKFYQKKEFNQQLNANTFRIASIFSLADINIIHSVGPDEINLYMSRVKLNSKDYRLVTVYRVGLTNFSHLVRLVMKNIFFRNEYSLVQPVISIRQQLDTLQDFVNILQKDCTNIGEKTEFRILFTNDQTLYSSMFLNVFQQCGLTEVTQHGIVRLPIYYFPVRADIFYYWEKSVLLFPERGKSSFRPIVKKIYTNGFCNIDNKGFILIATHSFLSTHKLLKLAKQKEPLDTIFIRPHPTSKYKFFYKLYALISGVNFDIQDISSEYIQGFSALYTEFTTLAIDFAYYGKSVYTLEDDGLPAYMDYTIGPHKCCQRMNLFTKEIVI